MTAQPFSERLATARRLVGATTEPLPSHVEDQLAAASAEARRVHESLGGLVAATQQGRGWRYGPAAQGEDQAAYLLAAVIACEPCPHVRTGGPQPVTARLALRRLDCRACASTLRLPPADESDRCDVCGSRGNAWFVPFAARNGPTLVLGDVCRSCARALQIDGGTA